MKKFVICDDDKNICRILGSFLLQHYTNCKVIETYNSHDCLQTIYYEKPDFVIIDMYLPNSNLSGVDICKQIRKIKNEEYIGILMITSSLNDGDNKLNCLKSGADSFLFKPIEYSHLICQVNLILRIVHAEKELYLRNDSKQTNMIKLRKLTYSLCNNICIL